MEEMLFCRVGWMEWYQGDLEHDPISGGGSYVETYGYGHEIYNFLPDDEGNLYGFVEVGGDMSITRLGAKSYDQSISPVLVVWCGSSPYGVDGGPMNVVGWYRNATVFRRSEPCPSHLVAKRPLPRSDDRWTFRVMAREEEAVLIPKHERSLEIPRARGTSSGFGRRNIWYADGLGDHEIRKMVLDYIASGYRGVGTVERRHGRRTIPFQPDVERRHRVEQAAMRAAESWYQRHGWVIQDVSALNRGWDIEARRDGCLLRVEVKGLSGNAIVFDLTPREYEQMKLFSLEGSYRVCVVVNALESAPYVYRLTYEVGSSELVSEDGDMRLVIEDVVGARVWAGR